MAANVKQSVAAKAVLTSVPDKIPKKHRRTPKPGDLFFCNGTTIIVIGVSERDQRKVVHYYASDDGISDYKCQSDSHFSQFCLIFDVIPCEEMK